MTPPRRLASGSGYSIASAAGAASVAARSWLASGWTLEHVVAIVNGGANAETNLGVTCAWCLPGKNAADVAEKSKTAAVKAKHLLPRPPSRLRGPGFRKAPKQHTATRPIRKGI